MNYLPTPTYHIFLLGSGYANLLNRNESTGYTGEK
jgi:hypothetical protein